MKHYGLFITFFLLSYILHSQPQYHLEYYGALKNFMHLGDVSAKVDLKEFQNNKHFYALGAAENLKGEIQVFNSHPVNTKVIDSKISVDSTFNLKASLLVCAQVEKWSKVEIPTEIKSMNQLETFVQQTAKSKRINVNEPFPFKLVGKFDSIQWHIIDWKDRDTEHTHEKHINSGLNGTLKNTDAEMIGFFSNSHHAIFTHHSTNMHIHFKNSNENVAGHADDFKLGTNMFLYLPEE